MKMFVASFILHMRCIQKNPAKHIRWSFLIDNTSARHEQHERHECNMSGTLVIQMRQNYDTSATLRTRVRHKCYTYDTSATQVKNFDFDNDKSKNIFLHPYIYYMASEWLQGEEQLHSKNYLLEMSRFHAKMPLKSAPQKTKLFNEKSYITKLYTRL